MVLGLIGAMQVEMERLIQDLVNMDKVKSGTMTYYTGNLYGMDVVMGVCGPGKVNAAVYADTMMHLFHPDYVINLGVAGAIDNSLNIGDIVIADTCVQHDMDTSPIGDPVGFVSGIGLVNMNCDAKLVALLKTSAEKIDHVGIHTGIVATGDQFISDKERKAIIADTFGAVACEMEGGAILHACLMHQVPCAVVRSISDKADGSAQMDYPQFVELAAQNSNALIRAFCELLHK